MQLEIAPREVGLVCRACGYDQFEYDDGVGDLSDAPDETVIKCAHCGLVTTKGELIEDNAETIDAAIDEIGEEAAAALRDELSKSFRRVFRC